MLFLGTRNIEVREQPDVLRCRLVSKFGYASRLLSSTSLQRYVNSAYMFIGALASLYENNQALFLLLLKRSRSIPLATSNRTMGLGTRSKVKHISQSMHFGIRLIRYRYEHRAYNLDCNRDDRPGLHGLHIFVKETLFGRTEQKAKELSPIQMMVVSCIGRESNPGLAES